jgi:peroxiredoxin
MILRLSRLSLVAWIVALLTGAGTAAAADSDVVVDKLNKRIDNFTLRDARGNPVSLQDLKERNRAIVVIFLSFDCPVSTSYTPVLSELAKSYADKRVAFLGIVSNDETDAVQIAKQAAEYKLSFRVVKDDGFRAADAFKADMVPSAFILDHNLILRYRGRIDNSYAARLKKNPRITRSDLRVALEEVLDGKPVSEPATVAVGCFLSRERATKKGGTVTFHRDVLPILQENCQVCHRPGAAGPFTLMNYKQAVNWAGDIKEYTQQRKMPPWKPVEGPAYHNDRRLNERDIRTLAAWVDGGTPEGDPTDAPPPRKFTEGWQLGEPDLVLTLPEEMTLGPSGPDLFRCFVLPTSLTEDKYVTAVEVRPGNRRIVHHSLNFYDLSGKARELEQKTRKQDDGLQADHGPGYTVAMGLGFTPLPGRVGGLSGWAPGQTIRHLPEGYGYLLPKGSDVILQLHYHRNGRLEKDRTSIGLYFAKSDKVKPFKGMVLPGRFLVIPPGNERFRAQGGLEVQQECKLYSVMPHMHMLGREVKVTLTPPGGQSTTLVAIKDWDYNWQETYFFQKPIDIKPGTRLEVEAFYDNSSKNPNNPSDPPRWVKFGEETTDEMCYIFFGATSDTPGRIKVLQDSKRNQPKDRQPARKK